MEALDWHARFLQQAHWTRRLRVYLFARAGLEAARQVLEVGCGTGAILIDLPGSAEVHGLDIDLERLSQARIHAPSACLAGGDAYCLPYPEHVFDLTFCHFLLLWVYDPLRVLLEMRRVTRPGGSVLALAEPDYTARFDAPKTLVRLGQLQNDSLQRQGADISLGGRLGDLFRQAGLKPIECGTLSPAESPRLTREAGDQEWAVLESDLAGILPPDEIQEYKALHISAVERGERSLHVPTWFAWAQA